MQIRLVEDQQAWEGLLCGLPHGNILQSYQWGEFKAAYGWRPLRLLAERAGRPVAGAQVLLRGLPLGALAYVPRGPMLDFADREAVDSLLGAIHARAREAGAFFLKMEPDLPCSAPLVVDLRSRGYRPGAAIQPQSSIVVDLRPEPKAMEQRLSPRTRYNIRLAERKGLRCRPGGEADLPAFYRLLVETAGRGSFAVHPYEYYLDLWRRFGVNGRARLLLVEHSGDPLAATMFFVGDGVASQFYSGSAAVRRQLKPNELMQWQALLYARELGCRSYDLWGIPDEVGQAQAATPMPTPPRLYDEREAAGTMAGVYLFKRGFGGTVVRNVGAYDYVYAPARYWLWTRALPLAKRAVMWASGRSHPRLGPGEAPPRMEAYEA
ncbi:MAG: lipid II:glycine glycyltransferase FemX [Chloroflexota bacterium]